MDLLETVEAVERSAVVGPDGDAVVVGLRMADGWSVGVRLAPGSERHWDVRQLLISAPGDAEGIGSQAVRDLPLGVLLSEARRLATREARALERTVVDLESVLEARGGRLGADDLALAVVASAYARLVAEGDRSPARTLADRHGGSPGTWTNRVTAARRRGFLTAVPAGAAGGRLTDEARDAISRG